MPGINSIDNVGKRENKDENCVYRCTHPQVNDRTLHCDGNCYDCGYYQPIDTSLLNIPIGVLESIKPQQNPTTLDEAIKFYKTEGYNQMAIWLSELKERREEDEKNEQQVMPNDKFVSFETAKLLHDFGYDNNRCFAIYDLSGENPEELSISSIIFDNSPEDYLDCITGNREWRRFGYYLAPTLDEVMRWLREVYKLLIVIDFYGRNYGERWQYEYRISSFQNVKPEVGEPQAIGYGAAVRYEKACDMAIQSCLKYLSNDR
jgi:hypothetical protein